MMRQASLVNGKFLVFLSFILLSDHGGTPSRQPAGAPPDRRRPERRPESSSGRLRHHPETRKIHSHRFIQTKIIRRSAQARLFPPLAGKRRHRNRLSPLPHLVMADGRYLPLHSGERFPDFDKKTIFADRWTRPGAFSAPFRRPGGFFYLAHRKSEKHPVHKKSNAY